MDGADEATLAVDGKVETMGQLIVVPQIDPSVPQPVFTITEKAPTRAFSWLKAPTSTFTPYYHALIFV